MAEYIEREKAIECIKPHVKPTTVYGEGYMQAIEHALDILELLPAADVQPVRRGKWKQVSTQVDEYNNHLYECTACRATDRHNINVNVPYCWHCGAKMDGDTR